MRLIGLTGKARAGKDTAGRMIESWAASELITVERHSFAAKLKIAAAACFGIPKDLALDWCEWLKHDGFVDIREVPGNAEARRGSTGTVRESVSGREFLQLFGTEAHREVFGSDFWVEALLAPLDDRNRALEAPDIAVITDARFENEAAAIRDRGGEVWEVVRPAHADELGAEALHASEAGLPEELVDRVIVNDGTLLDLDREVRLALVESFAA